MNSSDDEDDKFLYGSDAEEGGQSASSSSKRTLDEANNADQEDEPAKRVKLDTSETNESQKAEYNNDAGRDSSEEEDSSFEDESDSDSDVEFIIGTGADSTKLDSKDTATAPATIISTPSATVSGTALTTNETEKTDVLNNTNEATTLATDTTDALPVSTEMTAALDLDAPGKLGDQEITDIDPEVLKEKPWRQPGANLSDYFNYGFNEHTWMEYLNKQEKLRKEYNPQKILMGLLSLQQQGKLNETGNDSSSSSSNINTTNNNMPPPGFPPMGMPPMFGGFPPFPFPGMMNNMNPQLKK